MLGVQEPASAIFSLLNGLTVTIGFVSFRRAAAKEYPFHKILQFQFLVSCCLSPTTLRHNSAVREKNEHLDISLQISDLHWHNYMSRVSCYVHKNKQSQHFSLPLDHKRVCYVIGSVM